MCLAVAAKILALKEEFIAEVEVEGVTMNVSAALVPGVKEGDYVLVHAGFAIEIIDREAAEENLRIWKELNRVETKS